MTIAKGTQYGQPGGLPPGGVVARSDADVRGALEAARRAGHRPPSVGLLGGDLGRTLGAPGDEARLYGPDAVTFPVDVGEVLLDGRLHLFAAHLVARSRTWSFAFVAMNAQWLGPWNLGPRAHPGDGLLDTYLAVLRPSERLKVRSRLHHGAHLPHPDIRERRVTELQVELPRSMPVALDGQVVGRARTFSLRVRPDALTVVV